MVCTEPMQSLTYQIIGRGDVLVSNVIEVPDRKTHAFKFLASFAMVPKAHLVVYFITSTGNLVTDSVEIAFADELQNFIKLDLSSNEASPGGDLNITINTKPNSYIGLLGVDQSVLLLKKGNDLSKEQVFAELKEYESGVDNYAPWNYYSRRSTPEDFEVSFNHLYFP